MTISQLKAELENGPQEVAVYAKEIHELKSSLNSLQQQSQVRQNTAKHTKKRICTHKASGQV